MKPIQALLAAGSLALAASATPAIAQMSHAHGAMATPAAASAASTTGAGEVRKIDMEAGKLTLKHDAMQDMGMPAMTMVYPVANASVLRGLKIGDKVRFRAATAAGRTTITEVQAVQ